MLPRFLVSGAALLLLCACAADTPAPTSPRSTASLPAATPIAGTSVTIVSAMGSTVCTDVAGDHRMSGSPAIVWTCHGGANQQFTFEASGEIKASGGQCLDAWGGYGRDGDPVGTHACHGGANQRWALTAEGAIVGMNGKCLDVLGGSPAPGTAIGIYRCHGGVNQRWVVAAVSGAPPVAPPPGLAPEAPGERVGKYVAPNGTAGGSGTVASPLDLQTALRGGRVSPGDTVWVRGGTYRGDFVNSLNGTASQRITVRAFPGERATVDGHLVVLGSNVTFWGLEVMSSNPGSSGALGINMKAPGGKLVNMVVHDESASGMGVWTEAVDAEVYGSLVYNNGTHPNLDHGIYAQGNAGTKRIHDNIIFNNWTYGLHIYTGAGGYIRNFDVAGNVAFNNGTTGPYRTAPDLFVGGETPADNISFVDNHTFRTDRATSMSMGYAGGARHGSLTLRDNYVVGGLEVIDWNSVVNTGNTVITGATPSETRVVVRPNRYEPGRANVVVYNWGNQGSASADLSGVLAAGDRYVVRNVQDFFGAPVASGTYQGGAVSIPLGAVAPPPPVGGRPNTAPTTGPRFNAYVVMREGT